MCVAAIIAVGANADGRREVLGMAIGPSEAEPFRTKFLRSLTEHGLRGVKLVISDSHEGLKKAASKVLGANLAALLGPLHATQWPTSKKSNSGS